MRRTLALLLILMPALLFAQDVAEEELRELGTADINFINYEGPYDEIDTDEEIRSIGRALAAQIASGELQADHAGKYRIIHAVDPSVEVGFDADILIFLSTARVDHIDNVRRIISGYLEDLYEYQRADADLLARFVTIYNAVSRGNMEFFQDRYKDVVTQYMDESNAGLSRRYDEWPGKSRVVIPLGEGRLGAVNPAELADEQVVEELRSQEDMGIEDRQDMVDLTERVIEEREQDIDQREAQLDETEEQIVERQQEIDQDQEQISEEREAADEQQQRELDQREEELQQEEQQLQEERETVEAEREQLQEDRQEVAELTAQVREEREQIARDSRALLDESEIADEIRGLRGDLSPVYFIQVREESGAVLGQLVQINPINGLLLNRSAENSIVSRSYTYLGDSLLVIAAQGDTGRLAVFDVTTLEELDRGEDEIFLGSSLSVYGDPESIFAVVRDAGEWYVGKFDVDLSLVGRSVISVNPYTTLAFSGDTVWVQSKDDRIVSLAVSDLRVTR